MVQGKGLNDLAGLPYDRQVYTMWKNMLARVYGKKAVGFYLQCSVCEDWLVFSRFNAWVIKQNWKGMVIDKDIVKIGNNVYCPEFCRLVPKELNFFFIRSTIDNSRKDRSAGLPVGVYLTNNGHRFYAKGTDNQRRQINLGTFDSPQQAHRAWQVNKLQRLAELRPLTIDLAVVARIDFEIDRIQRDWDLNLQSHWY